MIIVGPVIQIPQSQATTVPHAVVKNQSAWLLDEDEQ